MIDVNIALTGQLKSKHYTLLLNLFNFIFQGLYITTEDAYCSYLPLAHMLERSTFVGELESLLFSN